LFPDGPPENGVDIIDIDARADHPAPGLKRQGIGQFGQGLVRSGLRKTIIDEAAAGLCRLDQISDEGNAVWILQIKQGLPFELGFWSEHLVDPVEVIDEEIIILAKSEAAQRGSGLVPRRGIGQGAACRELLVMAQHTAAGFRQFHQLCFAVFQKILVYNIQTQNCDDNNASNSHCNKSNELGRNPRSYLHDIPPTPPG
jgi:hypothetical protein